MKVLVVGNGGREHAIAWKISQSPKVSKIYVCPGNGLSRKENKCINIELKSNDEIVAFAAKEAIDLVVIGPEVYLMEGLSDMLRQNGILVLGPSKEAAKLEWSKAYAKEFMKKYGVTAPFSKDFTDYNEASKYIEAIKFPVVIKASGLAAGKGVVICKDLKEAKECLEDFMIKKKLKEAGEEVIIEEYLEGVEASILCITDGNVMVPFVSAKDHKKILEGENGDNTGGMGAVAPNVFYTKEYEKDFKENILDKTLLGIQKENMLFRGIVFFGLMLTKKGAYLLEYNVRFGDPETQAVLPLLKSDLFELAEACAKGELNKVNIEFNEGYCASVVCASKGYPKKYNTGYEIFNIERAEELGNKVFGSGVSFKDQKILTNGGRVLSVSAVSDNLKDAIEKAYEGVSQLEFCDMYYRKDIGRACLNE